MSALRKVIRAQLQNIPALALRNNVAKQIDAGGHLLPPAMVQAITEYILAGAKGEFTWNDPETGISPREPAVLNLRFDDNDLKEITASVERALDAFPDLMMKTVKQFGTKIAGDLRRRWPAERCIQDFEIGEFRDRLEVRWGKAFELYRILLTCCREVGRGSAGRFNRSKSKRRFHRRFVLIRLQARACQVAEEILVLLENGFADGAMARWRTLHEVTMTAALIAGGDEDLARRYMAHDGVDIKRRADDHDKTQVPLGYLPVPPAERRAIDRKFEHAIELFGSDFGGAYGWAAKHLGRPRPTFRDIQHEVDRSKMNPSYKVASFNVHAGSRSMFYRLSDIDNSGVILAGRSNAGMSQPAENAASSLLHISSLLYDTVWSIEQTMEIRAVIELRNLLSRSLNKADRKLKQDERRERAAKSLCKGSPASYS